MKKAIALRLNRKALLLIERMQNSNDLSVEFEPSSSFLRIGGREFPITIQQEESGQLYRNIDGSIHYVGDITHRASMKQVLSEEDKQRIRSRTEQAEREKNARRIVLLDHPPSSSSSSSSSSKVQGVNKHAASISPTALRQPPSRTKTSLSTSPLEFRSPAPTARVDPSSLSSAASSLKARLIHLLALKPRTLPELMTMLKVTEGDLKPMLKQVADHNTRPAQGWSLKLDQFKEIRIWEWSRYDDRERKKVRTSVEEAYEELQLPPDAPERANLIPPKAKPPTPMLIPPPSQRRASAQDKAEASPTSSSSRKRGAQNQDEQKLPKKRRPSKSKEESKDSSSSTSTSTSSAPVPAAVPASKTKRTPTNNAPTTSTRPARPNGKQPVKNDTTSHTDTPYLSSSTDDNESTDDEVEYHVESQADFNRLRSRHDAAQMEYIRFKERFRESHPLFIKALNTVTADEKQRDAFSQELLNGYLSLGGDKGSWQTIVRRSRKFNKSRLKLDRMWSALEKGAHDGLFAVRDQDHHRSPRSALNL